MVLFLLYFVNFRKKQILTKCEHYSGLQITARKLFCLVIPHSLSCPACVNYFVDLTIHTSCTFLKCAIME